MVLSSDELEILEDPKSWKGKYVSLVEICRSAGSRQRFKETPHWAKPLMYRLVESNLAETNDRGHYRIVIEEEAKPAAEDSVEAQKTAALIGEDYFPGSTGDSEAQKRWIAPHIAAILKKSGKKFGGHKHG